MKEVRPRVALSPESRENQQNKCVMGGKVEVRRKGPTGGGGFVGPYDDSSVFRHPRRAPELSWPGNMVCGAGRRRIPRSGPVLSGTFYVMSYSILTHISSEAQGDPVTARVTGFRVFLLMETLLW
jgi:hypothetical protein